MEVIHRARGGGKTTEMVKKVWEALDGGQSPILLTIHEKERQRVITTYGLPKTVVHTWDSAVRDGHFMQGRDKLKVYVEEAGSILESMIRRKIDGISIT